MPKKTTIDIPGTELVLGDAIKLMDSPYGWASVVRIKDDEIHLFRPYVHLGDTVSTSGIPHYVGTENFSIIRSGRSYTVDAYTHEKAVAIHGILN